MNVRGTLSNVARVLSIAMLGALFVSTPRGVFADSVSQNWAQQLATPT